MTLRRTLIVFVLFGLVAAPAANAQSVVDQLLRADVVVGPSAAVTNAERTRLRAAARELAAQDKPTKFVVRGEAPGTGRELARQLRDQLGDRVGFDGTVMVLWQRPRRGLGIAGPFEQAVGQETFERYRAELRQDPIAGVIAIAEALTGIEPEPVEDPFVDGFPDSGFGVVSDESDDLGIPGLFLLIVVGILGFGAFQVYRHTSHAPVRPLVDIRGRARRLDPLVDGLSALISDLSIDIQVAPNRADAVSDHDRAVMAYGAATTAIEQVQTSSDIDRIAYQLEEGIRAAKRARAILDRTPVPADDAPLLEGLCSFDPKHGAARTRSAVTGPNGGSATLPVCQACATAIAEDRRPDVRTVRVGDRGVPYWAVARPGASQRADTSDWLLPLASGLFLGAFVSDWSAGDDDTVLASAPESQDDSWWSSAGTGLAGGFGAASGGDFGGSSGGGFDSGGGGFDSGGGGDSSSGGGDVGGASGGDF